MPAIVVSTPRLLDHERREGAAGLAHAACPDNAQHEWRQAACIPKNKNNSQIKPCIEGLRFARSNRGSKRGKIYAAVQSKNTVYHHATATQGRSDATTTESHSIERASSQAYRILKRKKQWNCCGVEDSRARIVTDTVRLDSGQYFVN